MTYVILSATRTGAIRDDATGLNFQQDFTVIVGISGDRFGLSINDGTTATWPKSESGSTAETTDVPEQIQAYVDGKYNVA